MLDLISRDAAIAAIETAEKEAKLSRRGLASAVQTVNRAICVGLSQAVIEVSAVPSPWVSVNDAMPLQARSVLVRYAINSTILMDVAAVWACRRTKDAVFRDRVGTLIRNVTHWMELPAPPSD